MAAPRQWERGLGKVDPFLPEVAYLRRLKDGTISLAEYRERWFRQQRLGGFDLSPGQLMGTLWDGTQVPVESGDTLLCSCSVKAAQANACHRVWTAEVLKEHGWDVKGDWDVECPFTF